MFDAYIAFHARVRPEAAAIVTPDAAVSFARLDADVDRMAGALAGLAVPPGGAVAIAHADEYARWLIALALARLGIASAPAADPAAVRVGDGADATLRLDAARIAEILTGPRPAIIPVRPDPDAIGRVLRSSGTTGEEKRIGMRWRTIDAGIRNCFVAYGLPQGPWAMLTGIDSILGLLLTLAAWAGGQPVVLGIGMAITPALAARVRPALVVLVPDQLRRWLAGLPEDAVPGAFRVLSGGGPVPPRLAQDALRRLTPDLVSVYGASETGAVAVAHGPLLAGRAGVAGHVLPGVTVTITDAAGAPLPPGETGHVHIRSDRSAGAYLDGPAGGGTGFVGEWFVPGDLGRIDADGTLVIEGRADELMNVGGHKLLPGWIEAAALDHAGVTDAAVFAVTGADGTATCWLAIVRGAGFDEAGLTAALRGPLERIERLRWIAVEAIPRNAMGKILRGPLRALVSARFG